VVANAAAFTDGLLASELFGHARGAFTGAVTRHRGLFEEADGGTLFLDEVAEMPPAVQACVLRAIEHGEVRPLGAEHERKVDVRVIAATNADLTRMVAAGRFRHDLYRRLSVLRVVLPPLRARRADVPLLARHFLGLHAIAGAPRGFTDAALKALSSEPWLGNVRQIESVIVRAAVLGTGPVIDAEDVKAALAEEQPRDMSGELPEASVIQSTLERTRGNVSRAARILGVARSTLRDRLRRELGAA
jgi:two-component system response regulator HydG